RDREYIYPRSLIEIQNLVCGANLQVHGRQRLGCNRADTATAMAIHNVLAELFLVHFHECHQRYRCHLAKTAEAELNHVLAGALNQRQILEGAASESDAIQDLDQCRVAQSAGHAFAAAFVAAECSEIASHIDRANIVVEEY